jgi:hypothetical protein
MTPQDFKKLISNFTIKNSLANYEPIEMKIRHTVFGMIEHNEGM